MQGKYFILMLNLHLMNFETFSEWKIFSFCSCSDFDIRRCLFNDHNFGRLVTEFWKVEKFWNGKVQHFKLGSDYSILFIDIFDHKITFHGYQSVTEVYEFMDYDLSTLRRGNLALEFV